MKTRRRIVTLATATAILVGSLLAAPSASAEDWIQGGCSVGRGITGTYTYSAAASQGCWVAARASFRAPGAPQDSWTSWTPDGVQSSVVVTTPFPVTGGEVRADSAWRN